MVPNVGIVVDSRATLVADPGMGFKNGQVVLREVQKVSQGPDIYIVKTHFHPEHTTGEVAFPPSAQVIRAAAQQQDVDEMGMQWVERFRQRSPEIADLLKEATFRTPAEIFEQEKVLGLGGVQDRVLGMRVEAEAWLHKSLGMARQQGAKSLELRAMMRLSRLWHAQGKATQAQQRLAEVYGWFTEGFETPDIRAAHMLLAAWA